MRRAEMSELVERLTDAWNRHDPDAVASCYAPDAVSRDVTLGEPLHGRQAIRNAAAMYMEAFPDIAFEIRRIACDGDVLCEEWRATGTQEGDLMGLAPSGRCISRDTSLRLPQEGRGKSARTSRGPRSVVAPYAVP